jgi:hypothetical protein
MNDNEEDRSLFHYPGREYTPSEIAGTWAVVSFFGSCGLIIFGINGLPDQASYCCFGLAFVGMLIFIASAISLQQADREERESQEYLDRTRDIRPSDEE